MKPTMQTNKTNETGLIIRKTTITAKISRIFNILFYKDAYNLNKKLEMIINCNKKTIKSNIIIPKSMKKII